LIEWEREARSPSPLTGTLRARCRALAGDGMVLGHG
jgi:hypothetical protein